jgi:hypothetical protein
MVAGCNQDVSRPRIRGTVTFEGKPVSAQTLVLYSEGAAGDFFSQRIPLLADGTFSGDVPAPGNYKVAIEESLAVQEGAKPARNSVTVPQKYRQPGTSNLIWSIQPGDNYQAFELKE